MTKKYALDVVIGEDEWDRVGVFDTYEAAEQHLNEHSPEVCHGDYDIEEIEVEKLRIHLSISNALRNSMLPDEFYRYIKMEASKVVTSEIKQTDKTAYGLPKLVHVATTINFEGDVSHVDRDSCTYFFIQELHRSL